jgi:hypothetical protein
MHKIQTANVPNGESHNIAINMENDFDGMSILLKGDAVQKPQDMNGQCVTYSHAEEQQWSMCAGFVQLGSGSRSSFKCVAFFYNTVLHSIGSVYRQKRK